MQLSINTFILRKHTQFNTYSDRDRIPSAASLTVEAALVLPILLFAVLTIAYLGLLVKTEDEVRHAMVRTVTEASAEVGAGLTSQAKSMLYYRGKLMAYLGDTSLTTNLYGSSFLEENDNNGQQSRYIIGRIFDGVDDKSLKTTVQTIMKMERNLSEL